MRGLVFCLWKIRVIILYGFNSVELARSMDRYGEKDIGEQLELWINVHSVGVEVLKLPVNMRFE